MKVFVNNFFFSFLLWLMPTTFLLAQSSNISVDFQNEKIETILLDIASEHRYDIVFHKSYFEKQLPITIQLQNRKISEVLRKVLKDTNVDFEIKGKEIVLSKLRTVFGYIRDELDHEGLINVAVFHQNEMIGTYTNEYGYFSLTIPFELTELTTQYIGYKPQKIPLKENDKAITVYLKFNAIQHQEVIVKSKEAVKDLPQNVEGTNILPSEIGGFLSTGGEPDINQHLYKQTGVSAGPDGLGGLHVRGGSSSQNLFLLDGVRIFQPNHAFGLFSIFNTPLLKNAKFSKYNFNPKYAGGNSSVINMTLKEGSTKKWNGNISASTLASQVSINGPLINDKTSILLSFRRSHIDPFLKNRTSEKRSQYEGENGFANFNFYDVNAKLHHILGKNDKLYLSYYRGKDFFEDKMSLDIEDNSPSGDLTLKFDYDTQLSWLNEIIALKWNHLFGDKLFSSAILSVSNFEYQSHIEDQYQIIDDFFGEYSSGYDHQNFISQNKEIGFRYDIEHYPSDNIQNSFGVNYLYTSFLPGVISDAYESDSTLVDTPSAIENLEEYVTNSYRQNQLAIYANRKMDLSNSLQLNIGGRYGWLKSNNLIDSIESQFHLWNARIALTYAFNKKMKMLISVTKSDQEFHLLTSSDIGAPNDLWVPAIEGAKPQTSWQSNLLLQYQPNSNLKIASSVFYKKMQNLIRFPSEVALPELGTNISTFWEHIVWLGNGSAKGIELDVQYQSSKFDFNLAYTLSDYQRSFDSIENKKSYPFVFDQTHNFSFDGKYKLNERVSIYTHFVFNNGIRQTYFSSVVPVEPFSLYSPAIEQQLSSINGRRLPSYQRLDIGVIFNFGKKLKHEVVAGVQNLLNRENIYYEYQLEDYEITENKKLKAFPILPLFRYSLSF